MLYLFGFTQSGRKTADALLLDVFGLIINLSTEEADEDMRIKC